jgi:hypothetical protein
LLLLTASRARSDSLTQLWFAAPRMVLRVGRFGACPFASNPSRRLWVRLGFTQVGRIPSAVAGEDGLIYWRRL